MILTRLYRDITATFPTYPKSVVIHATLVAGGKNMPAESTAPLSDPPAFPLKSTTRPSDDADAGGSRSHNSLGVEDVKEEIWIRGRFNAAFIRPFVVTLL